ncbi:hypothetical protein [Glycomyces dulcitolivorans]|jgi:hypothetical protein|uniref:hypothetical protein n=1 Tax=Glycomyces dulcitolivorans TaxID=2200759 RepID=UPI000DD44DC9|nr:hypothetical protein [Glycomyces dulcitolivorans]
MKLRRALVGALVALMAAAGSLAIASPAQAIPSVCTNNYYANGRTVYADNENNGGGAFVHANICWDPDGFGMYDTYVEWTVTDTAANGAGATIRMEWLDPNGVKHYDVPPSGERAWTAWDTATGNWDRMNIEGLYIRACLTNTDSEGHHCGPTW